jgi:hypothetical protein
MAGTRTRTTATATAPGSSRKVSRNVAAELAYLTLVLRAPSLHAAVERLGDRARSESWTYEEFLAACLQREVAARESHGGEARIRAAHFPARKSLEDFDFDHQRSANRETIAHLGTLDFVAARENVVFLGPPGTGKTHLSIGLGIRACQAGHRVAFATAAEWVARLADAHTAGCGLCGGRTCRPPALTDPGGPDPRDASRPTPPTRPVPRYRFAEPAGRAIPATRPESPGRP